jgi:hypothetical protein
LPFLAEAGVALGTFIGAAGSVGAAGMSGSLLMFGNLGGGVPGPVGPAVPFVFFLNSEQPVEVVHRIARSIMQETTRMGWNLLLFVMQAARLHRRKGKLVQASCLRHGRRRNVRCLFGSGRYSRFLEKNPFPPPPPLA